MIILNKLPPDPGFIKTYRVILSQVNGLPGNVTLDVPREEFYAAAMHYKGIEARNKLLELEAGAKGLANTLALEIKKKNLADYMKDMFKEGRWSEGEGIMDVRNLTVE